MVCGSKGVHTIATRVKFDEAVCVRFFICFGAFGRFGSWGNGPSRGGVLCPLVPQTEQRGEAFQTLRPELFALTERTEQTIWTPRQDLGYQPAN